MDPTASIQQILCKSQKSVTETLAMIRQAFREESQSHIKVFEWKSPNSPRLKNVRLVKSKVKRMLIIFFDIEGIVHKEFILAGQVVNSHTTVLSYSD
jgi:hypothetical protein